MGKRRIQRRRFSAGLYVPRQAEDQLREMRRERHE
jgi:hypothetical protein